MQTVGQPIHSNSRAVIIGAQPEKGTNSARHRVKGHIMTTAHVQSVAHVPLHWRVYITAFQTQTIEGKYATEPITCATGSMKFCVLEYEVQLEPSEPSNL
jgi:hypothetical protein